MSSDDVTGRFKGFRRIDSSSRLSWVGAGCVCPAVAAVADEEMWRAGTRAGAGTGIGVGSWVECTELAGGLHTGTGTGGRSLSLIGTLPFVSNRD